MHIALWVVQGLLALAFLGAGFMKMTAPLEELSVQMSWIQHFPAFAPRLIGGAEVLGALGLILPSALRIKPKLSPLAASCLVALMLGAVGTHIVLGEFGQAVPSLVLATLAAFVAWGRTTKAPITPKS